MKQLIIAPFLCIMSIATLFAEPSDEVFSALAAKKETAAIGILQNLAFSADFAQLDKVQARDPGLFSAKSFPPEFVSKLIFSYAELAGSSIKGKNAEQVAGQNMLVLGYLFKAGIGLPVKLPARLSLESWGKAVKAYTTFQESTNPDSQSEFETEAEFVQRAKAWQLAQTTLLLAEIGFPAQLELGTYNLELGCFPLSLSVPAFDEGSPCELLSIFDLDKADIRYYFDRKAAQFFKEKGFAQWKVTAVLGAWEPGVYGLKELQVRNGKDLVTEGLWAFAVKPVRPESGPGLLYVENYLKDSLITINGSKLPGPGNLTAIAPPDGIWQVAGSGKQQLVLAKGEMESVATGRALSYSGKEIVIGAVGPVTGEAATFGISTKNAYEMAIDEWNAKGGIKGKKLRLVFADDKGDPTEGATAYVKLIQQDKVVAIVGTVMSKVSLAGAPICQSSGIPMISPTSTNPKVTEVGDFIFRACFIDPFQGTVGAKFAFNDLGAKKAAALFDSGDDYAKGLSEFFKAKFEELAGADSIVAFEGHASGTTDFTAQLTKILAAEPDVLYIPDYYQDVALIAKQARELGFEGPLLGGDGWDYPDLVEIGGAAVENGFFTNHYSAEDTRPIVQDFVQKYTAKYGEAPDALATLGYDAMTLILDAIKRADKTDGTSIRDALKATDLGVVSGQVKFDASRNPVKSAVIIEIKDGKQVYRTTVNP